MSLSSKGRLEIWRGEAGWTARSDAPRRWRQTVLPHLTAPNAVCAIAGVTPEHAWVRELSGRAVADDYAIP